MENSSEINVEHISVIVKKKEIRDFVYRCESRFKDGFIFITDGHGAFEKDGMKIPLKENSLVLLNYGDRYTVSAKDDDFEYITTAFDVAPQKAYSAMGLPIFFELTQHPFLVNRLEQLLKTWEERKPLYILRTKIWLEQILVDLFDVSSKTADNTKLENRLSPATDYINRFYDREITSLQLASLCQLSVSHFRRIFKEKYGISPLQYREQVRIHWAKQFLKSDLFTISETAHKLGYYDIYHFSKDFKKHTGLSPKQYLENNTEK